MGAVLDDLAARVKAGESGAALKLWEAVQGFVVLKARERARAWSRAPLDDLIQDGFMAVLDTAARYAPGEGKSFLQALAFSLRKAIAAEEGIRSTRRDALKYADSLDAPAVVGDEDSAPAVELIADEGAALAFVGVEYADFLSYCRGMIGAALDSLTPAQARIIRLHYLRGMTLEAAATCCGLSSKQAASETEQRGLSHMGRGRYHRELRECLTAFEDFREYGEAGERETWSRTGLSRTEAAALVNRGSKSA